MKNYTKLVLLFAIFSMMVGFSSLSLADGMIEDSTPEQREDEDPNIGNMDVKDPNSLTKPSQDAPIRAKEKTNDKQSPELAEDSV